jgi:hypothetical protein
VRLAVQIPNGGAPTVQQSSLLMRLSDTQWKVVRNLQ